LLPATFRAAKITKLKQIFQSVSAFIELLAILYLNDLLDKPLILYSLQLKLKKAYS
jgi:hypothetical protein